MPIARRLAVVLIAFVPVVLSAQTPAPAASAPAALAPADAKPLLGDWTIAADSPNGPSTWLLTLKVTDEKVVGEVSSDTMPKTPVTDITKRGNAVVLRYSFDYQGTPVATAMTLTPDGEALNVVFDFADGAFTMNGKATRKKT